jgi:hypothetical protein
MDNLHPLPNASPLHIQAQTQSRLAALGLDEALLQEALRFAYIEAERCSANDVRAAAGWAVWGKPLRYLGDQLASKGWRRDGAPRLESLVSPDGSFRITSAAGNFATGDRDWMPKTAGPKGRRALEAIGDNGQTSMDILGESIEVVSPMITHYLLHHLDKAREQIRAELSIPTHMTIAPKAKRGVIDEFKDRLILQPVEFGVDADLGEGGDEEDFSDDLDIPVPRRAASE